MRTTRSPCCAPTPTGPDLRSRGQLAEALELDLSLLPRFERVFGADHHRTLNVRNNIAADYRRLGRHQDALDEDQKTLSDRRRIFGSDDPITLTSLDAVARDLRDLGHYQESLDMARKVVEGFAARRGPENLDWLNARKSFAAALRKAGYHWDALQESEDVVQRYRDYLGMDHTYTLRAAANLINDRRAVGELARAGELGREVLDRCQAVGSPTDLAYAALVSLASVLRAAGEPEEALRYDRQARDGLVDAYGDEHPFTLEATINYASDLAACGDLAAAIRAGQDTLARCRGSPGREPPGHPDGRGQPGPRRAGLGERGGGRGDAQRRAAPLRGHADHRASRGPRGAGAEPAHRGDRAVLSRATSPRTRSRTWVMSLIRSAQYTEGCRKPAPLR